MPKRFVGNGNGGRASTRNVAVPPKPQYQGQKATKNPVHKGGKTRPESK